MLWKDIAFTHLYLLCKERFRDTFVAITFVIQLRATPAHPQTLEFGLICTVIVHLPAEAQFEWVADEACEGFTIKIMKPK